MTSRRRKPPVHSIFLHCSEFVQDGEWKKFFEDCSNNKFPRGIKYEEGAIKCTRKGLVFVEQLPADIPKAVTLILSIFKDRLKIKTSNEKKDRIEKFEKECEAREIKSWSNAKTVNAKQTFVNRFAERFGARNYMTVEEQRDLAVFLMLAINLKIVTSDDIIMTNGYIENIVGLKYNAQTRKPYLDKHLPKSNVTVAVQWPVDYEPKPQFNYVKHMGTLLDYHATKVQNPTIVVNEAPTSSAHRTPQTTQQPSQHTDENNHPTH